MPEFPHNSRILRRWNATSRSGASNPKPGRLRHRRTRACCGASPKLSRIPSCFFSSSATCSRKPRVPLPTTFPPSSHRSTSPPTVSLLLTAPALRPGRHRLLFPHVLLGPQEHGLSAHPGVHLHRVRHVHHPHGDPERGRPLLFHDDPARLPPSAPSSSSTRPSICILHGRFRSGQPPLPWSTPLSAPPTSGLRTCTTRHPSSMPHLEL